MTSDLILSALKSFIAYQAGEDELAELLELDVFVEGDDSDLLPPFVDLKVTGSKEHEVLRGVLDLSITARIATIPRDADGTNEADARQLNEQLYCVLGNYDSLVSWANDNATDCKIFHATDYGMQTDADADTRVSTITFTVTGCKI